MGVTRHYQFVDYATQLYLALVGTLVLCFHNSTVKHWPIHVAGHLAGMLIVQGLVQWHAARPHNRFVRFLRHCYPILYYSAMYTETGHLNQMIFQGYFDPVFIRLDQWLFGCQPSLELMNRFPWPLLSETLYFSYFMYYFMVAGLGLVLYFKHHHAFGHFISTTSFAFYVCYLIFILFPVIGPRFVYPPLGGCHLAASMVSNEVPFVPAAVERGAFYQLMCSIYEHAETPGAAFPSSHVALALGTLYFSFRYLRPIRYFHTLLVLLLCLATVYCRYHYVVDVIGGALTAAALVPLGNWLWKKSQAGPASPSKT